MVCPIGLAGCEARQSFISEVYFINTDLLINEAIRDPEVRLIGSDGAQLGVMPTAQAQRLADEARLDLVKIVPNARPPVRRGEPQGPGCGR